MTIDPRVGSGRVAGQSCCGSDLKKLFFIGGTHSAIKKAVTCS